jgi:surface antigen
MARKCLNAILVSVFLLSFLAIPTNSVNATPPNCTCVEYIKAYYGVTESVGNAKDMGTWLLNHGFSLISTPKVGAVVVMQPGFPGANATYGHVGILSKVSDLGSQWKISVKGSSQSSGGSLFSEFGCSNVRITSWSAYYKTNTKIKYYFINSYAIRSAVKKSGYANLYFGVSNSSTSSGAYIVGQVFTSGKHQLFTFVKYGNEYRIITRNSAMCIVPKATTQGSRLVQKKCTGSSLEKWQWIYTSTGYKLKNTQTGYVADLNNGSLVPGTSILIWSSHNGTNQRWYREVKN